MTYRRLVRPSEFMYLRFLGATIVNVLRLRGMVDADRFRAGVRRLQRAYPILDSHIVTDRSGASWYEELPTPFDGAVVPRDDDDTWRGVVDGQLTDYVDIWAGPLARITLVQGADRSEIVVAESHLASDGRGLSRQLHHLLRLMADPDLEIDPIPEVYADGKTLKAARPRLTDWSMFVRYHAVDAMYRALGAAWKLTGFTMDHDDPYMTDNLLRDVVRLEWVDLPFTQDETARLVARCRDRGVSVNSALTAAYLTIRRRLEPDVDFDRQATTVDVRRHLPGVSADQINLLASLVYTSFHWDDDQDFWANARRHEELLQAKLATRQDAHQLDHFRHLRSDFYEAVSMTSRIRFSPRPYATGPLGQKPWFKKLTTRQNHVANVFARGAGALDSSFVTSNLGRVDFDAAYGDLTVERSFAIAPRYKQCVIITSMTAAGRLTTVLSQTNIRAEDEPWPEAVAEGLRALAAEAREFLTQTVFE